MQHLNNTDTQLAHNMHTIFTHTQTKQYATQNTQRTVHREQRTTSTQNNTLAHTQTHTNIFDFIAYDNISKNYIQTLYKLYTLLKKHYT